MDYKQALEYLYNFTNYEQSGMPELSPVRYNLPRVERFLNRLGDPQLQYPSVVIAGTKGKGSTAALCAAALQASGRRVGLYSQPHLHTFRERARFRGVPIGEAELVRLVENYLRPAIESFYRDRDEILLGQLTTYEVGTALALLYFAHVGADFAVLEIGMGGRLDAVNVVRPLVSAIASISYDHTQVLGSTLAQIASEKAGIIKTNGLTITAAQDPAAMQVIEATCAARHSALYKVGEDIWADCHSWSQPLDYNQRRRISQPLTIHWQANFPRSQAQIHLLDVELPLLGLHQSENAALAAGILTLVNLQGVQVSLASLKEGFERVSWPGRLEVLADQAGQALVVADGAHNADSARRLREGLTQNFLFERLLWIVGAARDKDLEGIFRELNTPIAGQLPAHFILTQAANARAATPQTLLERGLAHATIPVSQTSDVTTALELARQLAGPHDLICVTGSLFSVADARRVYGLAPTTDPVY